MQTLSLCPPPGKPASTLRRDELAALGAIIDGNDAPLPPYLGKLLHDAPQSFEDLNFGQIAATVRAMRAAGEPVSVETVAARLPALSTIIFELGVGPLSPDAGEYYAETCWRAFQIRRAKSVFADSIAALEAVPGQAPKIIANAQAALDSVTRDTASGLTIRTPDEILEMSFDDGDIILGDRIIADGQSCVIAAAGGAGKSRLVVQLAACVTTGRKFLNFATGREDSVWLFLQTENSNRRLQSDLRRVKAWLGNDWSTFASRVRFHTIESDADAFVNLDLPDAVANIQAAIKQHSPDVVVIDPLNDFAIGDLNKDADMKTTLQTLSRICRKGTPRRAIVALHHALTGRAGAAKATGFDRASFGRNSKVLLAWTRAQINLAPVDPDSNDRLIVACGKCSNGREFPTFAVRLNPDSMIYECDPTVDVNQWAAEITGTANSGPLMTADRVAELCRTPMGKGELAKAIMSDCGCYRGSAYRYITRAERNRKLRFDKTHETYHAK